MLKGKLLTFLNCRGSSSSWGQNVFLSLSFFTQGPGDYFYRLGGCCTYAAANTQEQEATVSMKVHEMEADSAKGKQYFGWSSFWWPIRPHCLVWFTTSSTCFYVFGGCCVEHNDPLIKDWAPTLRRWWRHPYQMPTSQNARPPEISGCVVAAYSETANIYRLIN